MGETSSAEPGAPIAAAPLSEKEVTVETPGTTASRKLTRNDVAALMGVSPSTVVRRERDGVLRAQLIDGVHVYDETEVRRTITTLRHRSAISGLGGASGDVAALVFTEMDAGSNEVEVVKRHAIAPEVVKALVAQYRDFRGEVAIAVDELSLMREELDRLQSVRRTWSSCLACGRDYRVRACVACLASGAARFERRTVGEAEEIRYIIEDASGSTFLADWTPLAPAANKPDHDSPARQGT